MNYKKITLAGISALLGACAPYQYQQQPTYSAPPPQYQQPRQGIRGTVERIEMLQSQSAPSGVGAVAGGVVGGVVGHQMGQGHGNTAMTILGAVGGALAGNEAEKAYANQQRAFRISVRTSDGQNLSFTQPDVGNLREGDRVRIENNHIYPDY